MSSKEDKSKNSRHANVNGLRILLRDNGLSLADHDVCIQDLSFGAGVLYPPNMRGALGGKRRPRPDKADEGRKADAS